MPSPAKVIGLDLTSRHLIDVARSLFVAKGYAATKMDEVASAACVSKTTLYTRYPSKAELFAAVIAANADATGLNFDPAELAELPIPEALCLIAERFVEFTCQPEPIRLQLVYESEGSQLPEVVAAFERSGPERDIAVVERYLAAKAEQGDLVLEDPRFAAGYFLNAVKGTPSGISLSPYAELSPAGRRTHIRRIVALFLNGARLQPAS
jgi:TetR/AcrR family transcriptional regulator, mexJK operon transcriptional repressor